ncbi:hypothetical protein HUG10_04790 [Halorarum halophilum]|uniref:Uncharacterized protein n=1 Tax=Halorarum halophilum TaxID=2743090 RepID=A0A7D5K6N5_9EURY|nr:hypothetical protein [Halobaculum halophilum]QLG26899.1 hypothetical protein HUG10_04790 [Halobaculum halophilum]
MDRRRLLLAAGSFVLLTPECASTRTTSRATGEIHDSEKLIEFGWQEESPLVGGLSPRSETRYHLAVVGSSSDNDVNRGFLRENDGEHLLTFLDETSFGTNRILALQARHSSGARYLDAESLRLDVGERIEGSISIGTAEGGATALTRETLFVRFEVGENEPTDARITVQGFDGDVTVSSE